jgi:asparagine synthase (glutamine-hydrolysing)
MCGIVGIVGAEPRAYGDEVVRMRDSILHRGPDDAGHWVSGDGRVALGHRRLSIIDLSPLGHQPMTNEDDRFAWYSTERSTTTSSRRALKLAITQSRPTRK